jgi:hypothetical protein
MSDTTTIKFARSYGVYNAGERAGFTKSELEAMKASGAKFNRLSTQSESTSKSDPETRKDLKREVRIENAKKALEDNDYMDMKSALAKLSDEPATGKKPEIRERLEAIVSGA